MKEKIRQLLGDINECRRQLVSAEVELRSWIKGAQETVEHMRRKHDELDEKVTELRELLEWREEIDG